jgi:hypothetical protein
MVRTHLVVIKDSEGSISTYPLKQWLRENPDSLPSGMHPDDNTSHELRSRLKKIGWRLQSTPTEVLVIRPDELGDTSYADELIEEKEGQYGESIEQDLEDVGEITFGLERDLQTALRSNIEQLEPGLSIVDGGAERSTRAGRIDITSKDSQGNTVVIELKAGRASSDVIAQVLSYMSAIAETENNPVRGMIVAGDFSERVILAAKAVRNLSLVKYSFQFSFKRIE